MSSPTASATSHEPIRYEVVTPTGRVSSGECTMVVAPAVHGEVGIMKDHTPYLAALSTGVLRIKHGEVSEKIFISNGFIEAIDNKVIVLAEVAEKSDEIDVARAQESLDRAKKRLVVGHGAADVHEPVDRLRAPRAANRSAQRLKASEKSPT